MCGLCGHVHFPGEQHVTLNAAGFNPKTGKLSDEAFSPASRNFAIKK